jgi:hypothetical protein
MTQHRFSKSFTPPLAADQVKKNSVKSSETRPAFAAPLGSASRAREARNKLNEQPEVAAGFVNRRK